MILYGSSLSFFVRKTAVFAHEKGINFELKSIGRDDGDPEFRKASPFGKMPGLVDGDYYLADSSAIIHYLDALHPDPELIPADPRLRGRTIWFEEWADTMLGACTREVFFNRIVAPRFLGHDGDLEAAAKAERDTLPPLLDYLEGQIPDSGFLVDDRITLADLAVASPFVNLAHGGITVDTDRYPRLTSYLRGMLARESFASMIAGESVLLAR